VGCSSSSAGGSVVKPLRQASRGRSHPTLSARPVLHDISTWGGGAQARDLGLVPDQIWEERRKGGGMERRKGGGVCDAGCGSGGGLTSTGFVGLT
jgi:hypothetical protein